MIVKQKKSLKVQSKSMKETGRGAASEADS